MADTRLIERWLPIAEIGIESIRERTPMTPFPAPNRLHVWWARRPLVASRAAVLASLLPADADRGRFLHVLGIHGDPVVSRRRIDAARRTGERFEGQAYSYPRAFSHVPGHEGRHWLTGSLDQQLSEFSILDPTAGGGSIPLEASRIGLEAFANDLNPVAALIMHATVQWPSEHGYDLKTRVRGSGSPVLSRSGKSCSHPGFLPRPKKTPYRRTSSGLASSPVPIARVLCRCHPTGGCRQAASVSGSRRISSAVRDRRSRACFVQDRRDCCGAIGGYSGARRWNLPVSRLRASDRWRGDQGAGAGREDGRATLRRGLQGEGGSTRRRPAGFARSGCAATGHPVPRTTTAPRSGRGWPRSCRSGKPSTSCRARASPTATMTTEPIAVTAWCSGGTCSAPRQLLCHGTSVEVFREMLDADRETGNLNDVRQAAYGYLAFSIDKTINWNARIASWNVNLQSMRSVFDRHDFAFKWSYAEMVPLVVGLGYDWTVRETAKCIGELVAFVRPGANERRRPTVRRRRRGGIHVTPRSPSRASRARASTTFGTDPIDAVVKDPAVLRQRDVCGALRLLLRVAEAHGPGTSSRSCSAAILRTRKMRRSRIRPSFRARRVRGRAPGRTSRSAWRPFSPSVAGC